MDKDYQINFVDKPEEKAWGIIGEGLNEYNKQQAGNDHGQRICFVLQSSDGEIAGGIIAFKYWDWIFVDMMWMKEDLRKHGYGKRLLDEAENEARKRGAKHVYLDTFSFQAPEFYKKCGYKVFGELQNFPLGHTRYFLTKDL